MSLSSLLKNKCTRYWAQKDDQKEVGPFTIACLSEVDKHSHIVRELLILKDGDVKRARQRHIDRLYIDVLCCIDGVSVSVSVSFQGMA